MRINDNRVAYSNVNMINCVLWRSGVRSVAHSFGYKVGQLDIYLLVKMLRNFYQR
jgi:hypothetical protein